MQGQTADTMFDRGNKKRSNNFNSITREIQKHKMITMGVHLEKYHNANNRKYLIERIVFPINVQGVKD